ncbi:MAG: hypothetical protein P8Y97_22310 [Candidatus Lokiarchaeota archaeon]
MIKFRKYYAFFLVLLMVLSLNLIFVIPKAKASDQYQPGFCGNPPDITSEDNVNGWGYAADQETSYAPYSLPVPYIDGIHTVTPFNYEINMPGPMGAYMSNINDYIKSNNLHIESITSYRPVFYITSTSWYGHKLEFESSTSNSYTAEFNLGISSPDGSCSIYGGHSQTTSTTVGGGWSVRADNGKWRVIYAQMKFLHVYGNVTFFDNSVRTYDAVIMESVDFLNIMIAKSELGNPKELPMYNTVLIKGSDGTAEQWGQTPPADLHFDYNTVKSQTNYFGVRLKYNNNEYFGMNGGAKFTWGSSSSVTIRHTFNGTSSNLPSQYDYYNMAMNNFFNLNIKPHYAKTYGGGGSGCPYLSVYNGSEYVNEGLLNIHRLDGIDVITNHTLITNPEPVNGQYLLKLTEHPKTISYIDHVQLQGRLGNNGTLVPLELVTAQHCVLGNVVPFLKYSDDNGVIEKGADHNNGVSQYIYLGFKAPEHLHFKELIFTIEGNNMLVK